MAFHGALFDGKLNPLAIDVRQPASFYLADISQVFGMADLLASASGGSVMTSQIAAGRAAVKNTYTATQGGLYHIRNDAAVTTSAHTADPSNPKIDLLTVKVYDSETGGDSSDITQPVILPGTATSGATLANLTGAPGQSGGPSISLTNYIPIAYVLIPAGASSASSFSYLDARPKTSGWTNIATSQSTSSSSFTTLTTPDQVTGLTLATDGILRIRYQAQQQSSGPTGNNQAAQAAVFLNSNQVKIQGYDGTTHGPLPQYAVIFAQANWGPLFSTNLGLACFNSATDYNADVTTGQIFGGAPISNASFINYGVGNEAIEVGYTGSTASGSSSYTPSSPGVMAGAMEIFIAAGTYTASVQFKVLNSGTVQVRNRRFWVDVIPFN